MSASDEEKFVKVASAVGQTQAGIIVEYLRAEGIRAVSWGEGAGTALGLTVGLLGDIRIMVPEAQEEEALALLEAEVTDTEFEEDGEPESASNVRKAILGGMALGMSPIGAGVALGLSYFMGSDPDDEESRFVDCPECGTALDLSLAEAEQGWFTCPECDHVTVLAVLSRCPNCETELELSEEEVNQKRYQCPECGEDVRLQLEVDAEPDSTLNLGKAARGGSSIDMEALSPGVAPAFSNIMGSDRDEKEDYVVDCPICGSTLVLSQEEVERGWYSCPECDRISTVPVLSRCPNCEAEMELDEEEIAQRRYICPECGEDVRLK